LTFSQPPLDGRRALVTGAASGIGAACARALAQAGAHVIAADLDEPGALAIAGETGGEAWVVDLTDTGALETLTPLVQKQIADQARLHGVSEEDVVSTILLAESAVKRLVEPEEVAEVAVWLAGPSAGMASGSSVTIDGGWSAI
jgi:3-hydroxybutyrate dehydrogenase